MHGVKFGGGSSIEGWAGKEDEKKVQKKEGPGPHIFSRAASAELLPVPAKRPPRAFKSIKSNRERKDEGVKRRVKSVNERQKPSLEMTCKMPLEALVSLLPLPIMDCKQWKQNIRAAVLKQAFAQPKKLSSTEWHAEVVHRVVSTSLKHSSLLGRVEQATCFLVSCDFLKPFSTCEDPDRWKREEGKLGSSQKRILEKVIGGDGDEAKKILLHAENKKALTSRQLIFLEGVLESEIRRKEILQVKFIFNQGFDRHCPDFVNPNCYKSPEQIYRTFDGYLIDEAPPPESFLFNGKPFPFPDFSVEPNKNKKGQQRQRLFMECMLHFLHTETGIEPTEPLESQLHAFFNPPKLDGKTKESLRQAWVDAFNACGPERNKIMEVFKKMAVKNCLEEVYNIDYEEFSPRLDEKAKERLQQTWVDTFNGCGPKRDRVFKAFKEMAAKTCSEEVYSIYMGDLPFTHIWNNLERLAAFQKGEWEKAADFLVQEILPDIFVFEEMKKRVPLYSLLNKLSMSAYMPASTFVRTELCPSLCKDEVRRAHLKHDPSDRSCYAVFFDEKNGWFSALHKKPYTLDRIFEGKVRVPYGKSTLCWKVVGNVGEPELFSSEMEVESLDFAPEASLSFRKEVLQGFVIDQEGEPLWGGYVTQMKK